MPTGARSWVQHYMFILPRLIPIVKYAKRFYPLLTGDYPIDAAFVGKSRMIHKGFPVPAAPPWVQHRFLFAVLIISHESSGINSSGGCSRNFFISFIFCALIPFLPISLFDKQDRAALKNSPENRQRKFPRPCQHMLSMVKRKRTSRRVKRYFYAD